MSRLASVTVASGEGVVGGTPSEGGGDGLDRTSVEPRDLEKNSLADSSIGWNRILATRDPVDEREISIWKFAIPPKMRARRGGGWLAHRN